MPSGSAACALAALHATLDLVLSIVLTDTCRMDLAAARSGDADAVQRERSRFMRAIQPLLQHDGPKLLVTDSQVR